MIVGDRYVDIDLDHDLFTGERIIWEKKSCRPLINGILFVIVLALLAVVLMGD